MIATPQSDRAFERREVARIIQTGLQEDVGSGDVRESWRFTFACLWYFSCSACCFLFTLHVLGVFRRRGITVPRQITSLSTIPAACMAVARFLAKDDGVVAGTSVAEQVLHAVDSELRVTWSVADGAVVRKGQEFGRVEGRARSILTGERLALNVLQRMSGVATATRRLVALIPAASRTRLLDTRKTAPGLRVLDKMAVRAGGGINHRYALYDMCLIKDNHVDAAGGVEQAVQNVRDYLADRQLTGTVQIELEVRTLDEVRTAVRLSAHLHRVMLDNMVKVDAHSGAVDTSMLVAALALINGCVATEASGNVSEKTMAAIAHTNVDFVSVGAITHSVSALDISLKIVTLSAAAKL